MSRSKFQRVTSLLDQGIWSILNFAHVWLVAYFTVPDSLGRYIIGFSFCLLACRIHAALVAMPLATEYGVASIDRKKMLCTYHTLNDKVIELILIIGVLCAFILTWTFDSLQLSFTSIAIISLASGCLVLNEHIRRILLISGHSKQLYIFDAVIAVLAFIGIFAAIKTGMHGEAILLGFLLPGVASLLSYMALRKKCFTLAKKSKNICLHFKAQRPLLVNNLAQWATGQSGYFITALLLSSNEVAILAILRNLFGPLNILILSLEGILPKAMSTAFSIGGYSALKNAVMREFMYVIVGFSIFSIGIVIFSSSIVTLVYGANKESSIETIYLIGMAMVYGLAVLSRIVITALRAQSNVNAIGHIALFGLALFLISGVLFAKLFGVGGVVAAMVITESCMLGFLFLLFNTKSYSASMVIPPTEKDSN